MSVIRSKTISLEITRTYGNRKALRPSAAATHGTHGTRVFHLAMYRMMYIFLGPTPDFDLGAVVPFASQSLTPDSSIDSVEFAQIRDAKRKTGSAQAAQPS